MVRKQSHEEWISAPEAMKIISNNSGRKDIKPGYLHLLVKYGKIERRKFDERTYEYRKSDAEKIYVHRRDEKRKPEINPSL